MSARGRKHRVARRAVTRQNTAVLHALQVTEGALEAGPHSALQQQLSTETKALISAALSGGGAGGGAHTGHPQSSATRAKISASLTGKPHPHAGHPQSAATRAKISAALTGKSHPHSVSPGTKAKIAAALAGKSHPHVGHTQSAATKAKISESLHAFHGTPPGTHKKKHKHHPLKKKKKKHHHKKHKHHKKHLKHLKHPGARRVSTHPHKRKHATTRTRHSSTHRNRKPTTRRQHPRSRHVSAQHRFHARVTGPLQQRFNAHKSHRAHSKGRHAHLISAHHRRKLAGFVHTHRSHRGLARGMHGTRITKIRHPHLTLRAHRVWLHKPGGRSHHRL